MAGTRRKSVSGCEEVEVHASGASAHVIWSRIVRHAGSDFVTKNGKKFSYDIVGSSIALRNTNRMIPRSNIERALARSPLTGPGQLQDLQGPSYVYAIVTDPRVHGEVELAEPLNIPSAIPSPSRLPHSKLERQAERKHEKRAWSSGRRPGSAITDELRDLGFRPFELRFLPDPIELPLGLGTDWDTIGDVPTGPGLYAFTVENPDIPDTLRLMYVGMTTDLWMVTKGQLPGGIARGGQRYGRPKHAGETRKRINIEVTRARGDGLHVQHWLKRCQVPEGLEARAWLREEEGRLIDRWNLRSVGWNRG